MGCGLRQGLFQFLLPSILLNTTVFMNYVECFFFNTAPTVGPFRGSILGENNIREH